MISMTRLRVALASLTFVMVSGAAQAQTGSISGRVTNSQGAAMAGADVTLRLLPPPGAPAMPRMPNMPGMVAEQTTRSGADGTFAFDQVPPGQYALQADFSGFERSSVEITMAGQPQNATLTLQALEIPGAPAAPAVGAAAGVDDLLDRIKALEQRLSDLESTAVLSEPETRVRRVEVYVDPNGNEHEEPVPGAAPRVAYQRERVYRRQTINEKLEDALTDLESRKIAVGVSAATVTQFAQQTSGNPAEADGHAYQLGSGDLLFAAGIAQYTSFFADLVGVSGSPPDAEIQGLTLLNSYTARLVRQNEVNVREAWLRAELFSQRLAISTGRLDLTNYFDRNAFANDETSQFISDALVNNPTLGLAVNGIGVAGVFDPKNGLLLKAGFQQSSNEATNLSEALYTLVEADYVARPRGLSEGTYRVWLRNDNSTGTNRAAAGISADQKLSQLFGLFGRYGSAANIEGHDHFYSFGFQVQNGLVLNPLDHWGAGYAQSDLSSGDHEKIVEGYYNFKISEKLRISAHLQHAFESPAGTSSSGFLVPAIRVQAKF